MTWKELEPYFQIGKGDLHFFKNTSPGVLETRILPMMEKTDTPASAVGDCQRFHLSECLDEVRRTAGNGYLFDQFNGRPGNLFGTGRLDEIMGTFRGMAGQFVI